MYNQKLAYGGEISERRSNRTSQGAGWSTSQDHITSPSVDVEMVEVAAPAQLSQRKRAHNAGQKGNTQKRVKGDNSQPGPSRSRPQPTRSASARAQDSDRSSTDLKPGENGTCPFHGKWVKHPQAKCYTFANVIIPTSTESARSGVLTSNLPPPPPPPFVSTSATTEIGHTQALTARGVSSALDSFIAHYCTVPTPYGPFPYTVLVNMLPYDVTAATQRFITESMPPDFQKTTPAPLDSNDLSPETPSFGLRRLSLSEPTLNLDDLTKDLFSANSACVLPSEEFTSVPSWPPVSALHDRVTPAILDSGATRTISSCLSFFTNLRPHSAAVVIADGTRCLSQQIGDFHFQVDGVSFSLPDTLYIPEFRKTLISVNHLLLHTGAQMFFTAQHAALRRPGARDLIFAVLHGPSYAVLMRPSLRLPQHRGAGATIDEPMVGDAHPVTPIPLSSI
ncbi:hypothetical protein DFJ73DRAFT_860661 [Zopfochytrium polystomum]|nr:hypothetical protein DFJ73DRAFT_860661 [Zopfochytrium polystomum]